jgi:hypothetical protein
LTKRIDLRAAKKSIGKFNLAGGFDSFSGTLRSQYFMMRVMELFEGDKVWCKVSRK